MRPSMTGEKSTRWLFAITRVPGITTRIPVRILNRQSRELIGHPFWKGLCIILLVGRPSGARTRISFIGSHPWRNRSKRSIKGARISTQTCGFSSVSTRLSVYTRSCIIGFNGPDRALGFRDSSKSGMRAVLGFSLINTWIFRTNCLSIGPTCWRTCTVGWSFGRRTRGRPGNTGMCGKRFGNTKGKHYLLFWPPHDCLFVVRCVGCFPCMPPSCWSCWEKRCV